MPAITNHLSNRKFDAAVRFVARNYGAILATAASIDLVPAANRPRCLLGMYNRNLRTVEIVNRRRDAAQFVNTIVHELTHALQEYEGCLESMPRRDAEAEANDAAFEAQCDYLRVRAAH